MAKKKIKEGNLVLILSGIIILLILTTAFFGLKGFFKINPPESDGGGQGGKYTNCTSDYECPPRIESYCLNNMTLCNFTTYYKCLYYKCVPYYCSHNCSNCTGCFSGRCMQNLSDLIIYNISYFTNANEIVINVSVRNGGFGPSPPTVTKVMRGSTVLALLPTRSLPVLGMENFDSIPFSQAIGTSSIVTAIADANDDADEANEDNNVFLRIVYA